MVAVGVEQLGAEEFVERGFFKGEVYVDEKKQTYADMGYRRFNWINIWTALLSKISRTSIGEARSKNIDGNLSGDGLQNGGLLVVSKGGGEVLLNHREENPGDHVANDVILQALGISEPPPSSEPVATPEAQMEESKNVPSEEPKMESVDDQDAKKTD